MKKILILGTLLIGTLALPMIALLTLVAVTGTTLTCPTEPGGPLAPNAPLPPAARGWVAITHTVCPALPETFIAAVMAQESGFRPDAYADDMNGGTWGLFQLNAGIWQATYGAPWNADRNSNGIWDVKEPTLHAAAGGKYLCNRLAGVRKIRKQHPNWPATRQLSELDDLIIAHNAGEGRLRTYPALPAITAQFIVNVRSRMAAWSIADVTPPNASAVPTDPASQQGGSPEPDGPIDPTCPQTTPPTAGPPTGG